MRILSKRSRYAINAIQEEDAAAAVLSRSGKKIIKLNRGDPPAYFKTPEYTLKAYAKAILEGKTYYSSGVGLEELRIAVAKRYKRMYAVDVSPDDVIVTQGISEALLFINASLINQGDRAVIFRPYYTQYVPDLELYGGVPILERYVESMDWSIDPDRLDRSIRKDLSRGRRPKYLILTNPNNPTGTVLSSGVLEEVVEIANNYGMILVSDEIYDEITYNGAKFKSLSSLAKGVPHIILNGASKGYDATGFRIGFAIVPGDDDVSDAIKSKLKDFAMVRLSANTPAQYAMAEALNREREHGIAIRRMRKEIAERVNFAVNLLNESKYLHVVRPKGAFYLFPRFEKEELKLNDDHGFVEKLLKEEGVQITRGSGFGERNHIRIVALAPNEILEEAILRIEKFCRRHSK